MDKVRDNVMDNVSNVSNNVSNVSVEHLNFSKFFLEVYNSAFQNVVFFWITLSCSLLVFLGFFGFLLARSANRYNRSLDCDFDLRATWVGNEILEVRKKKDIDPKDKRRLLKPDDFPFLLFLKKNPKIWQLLFFSFLLSLLSFCLFSTDGLPKNQPFGITNTYFILIFHSVFYMLPCFYASICVLNIEEILNLFFLKMKLKLPIVFSNAFTGFELRSIPWDKEKEGEKDKEKEKEGEKDKEKEKEG